ncbi:unnamed protein product [Adineta steineri]|uniref:Uncharacterized protein n=1 Tax=Adineta steineri TaxID=433720 RepID=A0A815FZ25_9BILA|nr:unnamed protein product [Adineta steineri]CAF1331784.1 unnamed protein product [Adineta steineri]
MTWAGQQSRFHDDDFQEAKITARQFLNILQSKRWKNVGDLEELAEEANKLANDEQICFLYSIFFSKTT